MRSREDFIAEVRLQIGKPYQWGAKGPDSFDCSGLVTYCLDVAPVCSAELAQEYRGKRVAFRDCTPGCLLFYGAPAFHVMVCLYRWRDGHFALAGARGGDSSTKDLETAYAHSAMISVVWGDYWRSKLSFVADPWRVA